MVLIFPASSLHDGEGLGFFGTTRQSSNGPYPGLSYHPAREEKFPYGNDAFAGRWVGGAGTGIAVSSLQPRTVNRSFDWGYDEKRTYPSNFGLAPDPMPHQADDTLSLENI
jgi:hypothetical protein